MNKNVEALNELILDKVKEHYQGSESPLLMSDLGSQLKVLGLWPLEDGTITLKSAIDKLRPDITVVGDPPPSTYMIVVTKEHLHVAEKVLRHRETLRLLGHLPKSVLVAFCLDVDSTVPIHVQKEPPYRYTVLTPSQDSLWAPLDPEFRTRKLIYVDKLESQDGEKLELLRTKMEGWAKKNEVDLRNMTIRSLSSDKNEMGVIANRIGGSSNQQTALDRIYAAQPTDIAHRLVIPADIAIYLSKIT